jgi:hypothetical protein
MKVLLKDGMAAALDFLRRAVPTTNLLTSGLNRIEVEIIVPRNSLTATQLDDGCQERRVSFLRGRGVKLHLDVRGAASSPARPNSKVVSIDSRSFLPARSGNQSVNTVSEPGIYSLPCQSQTFLILRQQRNTLSLPSVIQDNYVQTQGQNYHAH